MIKTYKTIDEWKLLVLKKHSTAEFTEHEKTISAYVKTGIVSSKSAGFISKGNLKGEIHE